MKRRKELLVTICKSIFSSYGWFKTRFLMNNFCCPLGDSHEAHDLLRQKEKVKHWRKSSGDFINLFGLRLLRIMSWKLSNGLLFRLLFVIILHMCWLCQTLINPNSIWSPLMDERGPFSLWNRKTKSNLCRFIDWLVMNQTEIGQTNQIYAHTPNDLTNKVNISNSITNYRYSLYAKHR